MPWADVARSPSASYCLPEPPHDPVTSAAVLFSASQGP